MVHDDGTLGAQDVSLSVRRGELVLRLGQIGSGKSSLLAALAGLVDHTGSLRWNGREVGDPQRFLRPGQVAYLAQVPRVLSGSFANLALDHERDPRLAVEDARLSRDIAEAGGLEAIGAELVLADDVSSALDARTEVELWQSLRARGTTVLGSTAKRAALRAADRVVGFEAGHVVGVGPWAELAARWDHLAG